MFLALLVDPCPSSYQYSTYSTTLYTFREVTINYAILEFYNICQHFIWNQAENLKVKLANLPEEKLQSNFTKKTHRLHKVRLTYIRKELHV